MYEEQKCEKFNFLLLSIFHEHLSYLVRKTLKDCRRFQTLQNDNYQMSHTEEKLTMSLL